jgi:alpha-ketoglutarate-dependent taurine dioxygenase
MRNTRFEVRPTSGALGAELLGFDLAQALDAEVVADIRQAFNEHGVIFFRDQRLTPERHIAFAERMGPINTNRPANRRGQEGARANDQYRRRLAHGSQLRPNPSPGVDPAGA